MTTIATKRNANGAAFTLADFNNFMFNGFNYELPANVLKIISELSLEVGSPDYVKTPIFVKKEKTEKVSAGGIAGGSTTDHTHHPSAPTSAAGFARRKKTSRQEETWDSSAKTFQTTKMEERTGICGEIDNIRSELNKLTDKNFIQKRDKIAEILANIVLKENNADDTAQVSCAIFDIASTNRFYSKLYADLYCDIITQFDTMRPAFESSLDTFAQLFDVIEYVDPVVDYDKFCKINKTNEKRKALGVFFINLSINGIIPSSKIVNIKRNLLSQIYTFISQENKKNEVDELTENVCLFHTKECRKLDETTPYELIDGFTMSEIISKMAKSKVKDHKSITNKTIFKFMDMLEMA